MYKSKLLKILKTFDENEWKDFRAYLLYKNPRNPKILDLYDYIRKYKDNFTTKKFDIEEARTSIKLGLMARKNFQNAMSRLKKIIEEYLVIQSVLSDELEGGYRVFQIYNDRNLYDLANNKVNSLKNSWNNSRDSDLKKVEYLVRLQHSLYFSENPIKYVKEDSILKNLMKSFNDFNFIYQEFYTYAADKAISIKLSEPHEFEDKSISDQFLISETANILVNINKLNKTASRDAFEYLYNNLKSNDDVSPDLRVHIFGVCESYLTKVIMKGESEHDPNTILFLYQLGISKGILLYNNSLSTVRFHNILSIACFLEEFDWAEDYVENYINLVPIVEREESLVFAKIKIHFGKWEYEEALNLLTTSDLNNFFLKAQGRWYSLVIYFITFDNLDFFESQISNFIQFFYYNKKRISHRNFDGSLNLAKIFRASVNYGKHFDLDEEIGKYENITFKNRLHSFFEQRRIYKDNNNIDL